MNEGKTKREVTGFQRTKWYLQSHENYVLPIIHNAYLPQ